jgi:hypothetical protein
VDLRTFLPARRLPAAQPPDLGARPPDLPNALEPGRPALVAFLRHTGCPFAEATIRMLRDAAAGTPEVQLVAISHAPPDATDRWCAAVGGSGGVRLASDPTRASYAAWGLGQTSLGHFLGGRSLGAAGRLAAKGIRTVTRTARAGSRRERSRSTATEPFAGVPCRRTRAISRTCTPHCRP